MSRRKTRGAANRKFATYPTFVMAAAVVGALIGRPSTPELVDEVQVAPTAVAVIPQGIVAVPPAVLMEPPANQVPRLAIMAIHGGGWVGPQPELIPQMEKHAGSWHRRGWAILVPEYNANVSGLDDLLAHYDALQERYPETPICLYGFSAGAHLALMLAVERSDVACIVSEAGPTDLPALSRGPDGPAESYSLAVTAFGEENLAAWSPIRFADKINASVLQVAAANDPVVPADQARRLQPRLRSGTLRVLDPGTREFIHSTVDSTQLGNVYKEELAFLTRFERRSE